MVVENGEPIGQLELTVKEYEGKEIGYVNLYYLIPEKRRMGLGYLIHEYAIKFFKEIMLVNTIFVFLQRIITPLHFYKKNGMKLIKTEMDGKLLRMAGRISA